MSRNKKEYPDPFEKMAEDLIKAGENLVKETRNGRPKCPNCGERLWKKKNGDFSCPKPNCERDRIVPEEIATRKIADKFTGVL